VRLVIFAVRGVGIEEQALYWNVHVDDDGLQTATALPFRLRGEGAADPDSVRHNLRLHVQSGGSAFRNSDDVRAECLGKRQVRGVLAMSTRPAHQIPHLKAER